MDQLCQSAGCIQSRLWCQLFSNSLIGTVFFCIFIAMLNCMSRSWACPHTILNFLKHGSQSLSPTPPCRKLKGLAILCTCVASNTDINIVINLALEYVDFISSSLIFKIR